jgi:hypothetical protein
MSTKRPRFKGSAAVPDPPGFDPAFPLAHRTDLSEHERGISAASLAMLDAALADCRARLARGEPLGTPLDFSLLAPDDDTDE